MKWGSRFPASGKKVFFSLTANLAHARFRVLKVHLLLIWPPRARIFRVNIFWLVSFSFPLWCCDRVDLSPSSSWSGPLFSIQLILRTSNLKNVFYFQSTSISKKCILLSSLRPNLKNVFHLVLHSLSPLPQKWRVGMRENGCSESNTPVILYLKQHCSPH